MSWKRPKVVTDGDKLVIHSTDEAEYRVPFTFVEALNEGVLFDRSARNFKQAAQAHHLFEVINTRTEALIGTCILQENPTARGHQYEVGGMMIHPEARHIGLNTLLTKVVMVREFGAGLRATEGVEYIAHVVDGNEAPVRSLLECGFRAGGSVIVKPKEVDADTQHMIEVGSEGVVMQSYIFDMRALTRLVMDIRGFLVEDQSIIRSGNLSVHVDLSALVNVEALDRFLVDQSDDTIKHDIGN